MFVPQLAPSDAHVFGRQTHCRDEASHSSWGPAHEPHDVMVPPQPSGTFVPQRAPSVAQVFGTQRQLNVCGSQVKGAPPQSGWLPQVTVPPQPSGMLRPHVAPSVTHVFGTQPQRFAFRAPHVSGARHDPQSSWPPQPSGAEPQLAPTSSQRRSLHMVPASMGASGATITGEPASSPPSRVSSG
jgi:hypothetical protein